jgi:hypothetical protein
MKLNRHELTIGEMLSVTRPVKELEVFYHLIPALGQKKINIFELDTNVLGYHNSQ